MANMQQFLSVHEVQASNCSCSSLEVLPSNLKLLAWASSVVLKENEQLHISMSYQALLKEQEWKTWKK